MKYKTFLYLALLPSRLPAVGCRLRALRAVAPYDLAGPANVAPCVRGVPHGVRLVPVHGWVGVQMATVLKPDQCLYASIL